MLEQERLVSLHHSVDAYATSSPLWNGAVTAISDLCSKAILTSRKSVLVRVHMPLLAVDAARHSEIEPALLSRLGAVSFPVFLLWKYM